MKARILIIEDDEDMRRLLVEDLGRRGYAATGRKEAEGALAELEQEAFDVVLTDLSLPGLSGLELCERVTANRPDVPVIVMTAFGSMETAIAAIRSGAYDFVTKPIDLDLLTVALERALRHRALTEKVRVLSQAIDQAGRFGELVGHSEPMAALFEQLRRVATTEVSVLIAGETGTGKELIARGLHQASPRAGRSFVAVNCPALPETLLESELFGHKRGAFTDAREDRVGLFLEANRGTLFLDEVGELPLAFQPKLLRVLEERTVRPVGSNAETAVDVRILAATNRDLDAAVAEGRFREDLFYRLNVVQLRVPPLRTRATDILLLAQMFLERAAARSARPVTGLSEAAAEKLLEYSWPGNVRELRNAIERAVAMTRFERVAVEDLPEKIRAYRAPQLILGGQDPGELATLEEIERRYILHVLDLSGGNRTMAARILGLDRKTISRKLARYGHAAD